MSKIFSFSNVNSIKDVNLAQTKQRCLIFEKYIQNKLKKQCSIESPKILSTEYDLTQGNNLLIKSRNSQPVFKKFELLSHRLTQSEKSLNSILVKKINEPSSTQTSSRRTSGSKKVSFKSLVVVINADDGIRKRQKLVDKESRLRNGYFFNTNQIRIQ